MAICIAGKNLIAVHVLSAAVPAFDDVICLPNPDDNGEDGWQPSLRRVANGLSVPIVELDDLYDDEELCFLSVEYARLIRPDQFRSKRLFNVHFSLLPKYRGCNTAVWPILSGEREHGVTLHVIDAGMDTGPIIDQRSFSLDGMTAYDAYMACQKEGTIVALDWLPRLTAGDFEAHPQEGKPSVFFRNQLDFGLKEIDLADPTKEVMRRIRAFTFPAYQLPTLGGREIVAASTQPVNDWESRSTSDGRVWLQFAS
jgi:methionyl-tRNA formyltransferase